MTVCHRSGTTRLVVSAIIGIASFCSACLADEVLPVEFFPQATPEASSLTVTMSSQLAGAASDSSGLSGTGILLVGQTQSPFEFAQLADLELVLVDGMDFSLLNGFVTAQAAPGATRLVMVETGEPGDVVDGNSTSWRILSNSKARFFCRQKKDRSTCRRWLPCRLI